MFNFTTVSPSSEARIKKKKRKEKSWLPSFLIFFLPNNVTIVKYESILLVATGNLQSPLPCSGAD